MMKSALCVAVCVALSGVVLARQSPAIDIAGLWVAEVHQGPALEGSLSLEAHADTWRARLGEAEATASASGSLVHLDFGAARGKFRGILSDDRSTVDGHWIQPAGLVSNQPRATPVRLARGVGGSWQGPIVPLQERLVVAVHIVRRAGSLVGVVRIPETNWWGNAVLDVRVEDHGVTLAGTQDSIVGRYDAAGDRLLLPVIGDTPQVFTRRSSADPSVFYPRTPWPSTYTYATPHEGSDGWKVGAAADAGLNPARLAAFVQAILDADPSQPGTVHVHSLLMARRGRLVVEEYFNGFTRERPHDLRSAGKTIAPMLVGAVRLAGARIAPSMPLTKVFQAVAPFAHNDARKSGITLEHAMTMTSGLACDDGDASSPGREDAMQSQLAQVDWYRYVLDLPMARAPGGPTAVYCSGGLHLVGGAAAATMGVGSLDLFDRYIAKPLEFAPYHANVTPTGEMYGGGGIYLRSRDALKLGQLYLDGGEWNGVRVVSKDWVARSTRPYAAFARPMAPADRDHRYGYGWHIHDTIVDGRSYRWYAAEGNGGQWIMVFPALDLVVGITGGKYMAGAAWYGWGLDAVARHIIPAAVPSRSSVSSRPRRR